MIRLRRAASGSYIFDHPQLCARDVHYRIERGWADAPGTDRRNETWILTRVTVKGDQAETEILADWRSRRDARDYLERLLTGRVA